MTDSILLCLDKALATIGYSRIPANDVLASWVRREWSNNRAVVAIAAPLDADPALYAIEQRGVCRVAAGFFIPFFYEIGLQIIVIGPAAKTPPASVVDTYSNQICTLQSVHIVDVERGLVTSGATWGQTLTQETQSVIAAALQVAVSRTEAEADAVLTFPPLIQTAETPTFFRIAGIIGAIGAVGLLLRFLFFR